jgi:hypothetical protein
VEYGGSGLEYVRAGRANLEWLPSANRLGLLNEYSFASPEEDFNEVAKNLMCGTPGFDRLLKRYPRIARKAKLVVRFYSTIDPEFSHADCVGVVRNGR